jgi:vacuolar protein 8
MLDQDGEGEIATLARRILDLTEDGRQGEDSRFASRGGEQESAGQVGSQNGDHAALRASVHQALRGGH